jgi:hypothetical protein
MSSLTKMLDKVRDMLRLRHESSETEKVIFAWLKRFVSFRNMKPFRDMRAVAVDVFSTYLAV